MSNKPWRSGLLAICALLSAVQSVRSVAQQPSSVQPVTHNLMLSNTVESVDLHGRRVLVTNVAGDLPGVLTLALEIGPGGVITGGEWALNVSYIQLGPPDNDGDGDASESLVQRGVIKRSISGGSAVVGADGLASELSGIQLNVTGATLQFAGTRSGNGTVVGSSMNHQNQSSGSLTVTF